MKRLFGLAVLFLAVSGVPAEAQLFKINKGDKGNGKPSLGPWYQYWPLEAHFQVPASPQYPYWPAPMTLPITQPAAQGMGGYSPYGTMGGMQTAGPQAAGMGGYNPYAAQGIGGYSPYGAMGNMQMPGAGAYNPYGAGGYNPYGMGGYGAPQAAPTLPAGNTPASSAPTIQTGN